MSNKLTIQKIFLFGIFFLLFFLVIYMLSPFSTVLLWTCLLYILIRPLYNKATSKISPDKKFYKLKKQLSAVGFSLGTLILIIGPLSIIGYMLFQQCLSFLQTAETFLSNNQNSIETNPLILKIQDFFTNLGYSTPDFSHDSIKNYVIEIIQNSSSKLFELSTNFIGKTGFFLLSLVFIIFALYFCFLDGEYLVSLIRKAIPINPEHMDVLIKKLSEITKNLFSGYILVALYQGIASLIIMICFGVPGALLFSVILMLASFVPIFGAGIVWLPIGIILCITDSLLKGILFIIISAFCISFLDNFLRPLFLKDRIKIHPLVIFFSILGGIKVFGMNGLVLGPLIVILFFTVLDLIISQKNYVQNKKNENDVQNI